MANRADALQILCMARTNLAKMSEPAEAAPGENPGHFLREWRLKCDLTLEDVTADLRERAHHLRHLARYRKIGATHGNLSRIERGQVPYSQPLLELLADIYHTDPASLLKRNPLKEPEPIEDIVNQIPPESRAHASDVLRTFVHKIGDATVPPPAARGPKPHAKRKK